jgi:hypothetical protein
MKATDGAGRGLAPSILSRPDRADDSLTDAHVRPFRRGRGEGGRPAASGIVRPATVASRIRRFEWIPST